MTYSSNAHTGITWPIILVISLWWHDLFYSGVSLWWYDLFYNGVSLWWHDLFYTGVSLWWHDLFYTGVSLWWHELFYNGVSLWWHDLFYNGVSLWWYDLCYCILYTYYTQSLIKCEVPQTVMNQILYISWVTMILYSSQFLFLFFQVQDHSLQIPKDCHNVTMQCQLAFVAWWPDRNNTLL